MRWQKEGGGQVDEKHSGKLHKIGNTPAASSGSSESESTNEGGGAGGLQLIRTKTLRVSVFLSGLNFPPSQNCSVQNSSDVTYQLSFGDLRDGAVNKLQIL